MAGAGWRQWTRERLSQTLLQTFLQDQVVLRFASASARDAALPSPSEGMVCTLDDTDRVQRYNGSAWVDLGAGHARAGAVAIQQTVGAGGTYAFTGVQDMPMPYVGAVMLAQLSAKVAFPTAAQQTLSAQAGVTGGTVGEGDHDQVDRVPGAPSSGSHEYLFQRSQLFTATAATATVGYNFVVGTGGSSVIISNPRCRVIGPFRYV